MAHASCARGWDLHVERGPEWLFVRPQRVPGGHEAAPLLAEQVWSLLEQSLTHRVVLDMSEIHQLDSLLLEQLLWLHQQTANHDGMMRICGLDASNEQVLAEEGLDGVFGHYRDYEAAVMGDARPPQPR